MTAPYAANLTNHNPENYSKNASFVYSARYAQAVLALLDPQPGERIVDLGCGTGELTRLIADAVGTKGKVVGVDSSEAMVSRYIVKASTTGPELRGIVAGESRGFRAGRSDSLPTGRHTDSSRYERTRRSETLF